MTSFNPVFGYIAAGALVIGLGAGWKLRDWQCDAAVAKAYANAERMREEMQDEVDERSEAYEAERDQAYRLGADTAVKIRTVYKDLPPVSDDCAADPLVVGLLESSRSATNASATGKPGD